MPAAPERDTAAVRERLLYNMAHSDGLPALSASISRVVQLASSDSDAVGELAHFVLADVALTQKLLRVANTVFYRSVGGSQVTTVSRAIFVLGFETVRTIALAMMLVEGMAGHLKKGVREELAVAVAASVMARELATRTPAQHAEESAVAALFGNTGALVMAAYAPETYTAFRKRVDGDGRTPVQAANELIGCSLEQLRDVVLRDWHTPDSVLHALAPLRHGPLRVARTREEWMQQAVTFSGDVSKLVLDLARGLPHADAALKDRLLSRYGEALDLNPEKLDDLLTEVVQQTLLLAGELVKDVSSPAADTTGERKTKRADTPGTQAQPAAKRAPDARDAGSASRDAAREEKEESPPAAPTLPAHLLMSGAVSPAPAEKRHPSGKPFNAAELLMAGIQDVTEMMASRRCGANDVVMLVLETLYQALGCRFAAFCLLDPAAGQYRARVALGEQHETRMKMFAFPASGPDDVFRLALHNKVDVVIADAGRGRVADLIPAWHRFLLPDTASFVVLPLLLGERPVGLFYADRARVAPEGIPADEAALIRTLKMQVVLALQQR